MILRGKPVTTFPDHALARRDVVPELQRVRDGLDRLDSFADTANRHVTVTQDSTENGWIHVHAFNLVKVHFEGGALDEAFLVYNPQAGDVGLGGPAMEPGLEGPVDRNEACDDRDRKPEYVGAAALGTPLHDPADQR